MIIKTEEFKEASAKILAAIDNNELSTINETLELKAHDSVLYLNVTNKEYFVSVKFNLDTVETFHATVNANLFLKLVSQITSNTIELGVNGNSLTVKANGDYKLPLIFEGDKLLELPAITIDNATVNMAISGSVLQGIMNHNTKELLKGTAVKPVQKMYYVDEQGCITFTTGACVNSFTLPQPVKILLNQRLVKLFKLFKDESVSFTLGYDSNNAGLIQTKVAFKNDTTSLTAILNCDDALLASVPVTAIRGRANNNYAHSAVLNREELSQTISRLLLFSAGYGTKAIIKPYSLFKCSPSGITIYDAQGENNETLSCREGTHISSDYSMTLDLTDVKNILDSCTDEFITLNFGDDKAAVIVRGSIRNVLPLCSTR